MARVALLSNPRSTGNRSLLPRVRSFCAEHSEIFHYEVEHVDQIGDALRTIARVNPRVLVINGGDGTVQAALTELYQGGHFGNAPPPVAVLPNGKTNLIALDLGAEGDPIVALERVLELANSDIAPHIVSRELIQLSDGEVGSRAVLGMFLGGAGLADTILYCRHKIYPLGLPNGVSHAITAIAVFVAILFGIRTAFLPPLPAQVRISVLRHGVLQGSFALLMVTTLQRLLLGGTMPDGQQRTGSMQLMAIDGRRMTMLRALYQTMCGNLGENIVAGIHVERGDEIRIESERSNVILDGELFVARANCPIVLRPTAPVPFLRLAA